MGYILIGAIVIWCNASCIGTKNRETTGTYAVLGWFAVMVLGLKLMARGFGLIAE